MKLGISERFTAWSAILVALVSLGFSVWQGSRLHAEMVDTSKTLRKEIVDTSETLRKEIVDTSNALHKEVYRSAEALHKEMVNKAEALHKEMVQTSEVNNRIMERIDYFEVWKISDKLTNEKANIFMCKWRDCAARRGLVDIVTAAPRVYEVSQSGRDLVNELENGLFQWLADRKENYPDDRIEDILSAVNMRDLHRKLYKYNKISGDPVIPLESVFGILVAYICPNYQIQ